MISIIVPVFNGEKYLNRLFNCFRRQTTNDFEVIIVDDGSIDYSLEVARKEVTNCDFLCTIVSHENMGVSHARNVGLDHAYGDYVMFVDVDDLITDNRIEVLTNLAKETHADVVLSSSKIIKDYNVKYDAIASVECSDDTYKLYSTTDILEAFLLEKVHTGVCGGIINRQMIEANGIRFVEGCKYSEDLHFMWRAFACSKMVCVSKKITYLYMWVPNSAMSKFNKDRLQGYKEIKALGAFMKERVPAFAGKYNKYAASRILWSIARQASCVMTYREFVKFFDNMDINSEMKSLLSYGNRLIRFSSFVYLIHPFCFYTIARIEGKRRIHR